MSQRVLPVGFVWGSGLNGLQPESTWQLKYLLWAGTLDIGSIIASHGTTCPYMQAWGRNPMPFPCKSSHATGPMQSPCKSSHARVPMPHEGGRRAKRARATSLCPESLHRENAALTADGWTLWARSTFAHITINASVV